MTHRPSRRTFLLGILAAVALTDNVVLAGTTAQRWSQATAAAWYAQQPWLVGANYVPANAINQLEMWQPERFDPERIDRELGWAQALGQGRDPLSDRVKYASCRFWNCFWPSV